MQRTGRSLPARSWKYTRLSQSPDGTRGGWTQASTRGGYARARQQSLAGMSSSSEGKPACQRCDFKHSGQPPSEAKGLILFCCWSGRFCADWDLRLRGGCAAAQGQIPKGGCEGVWGAKATRLSCDVSCAGSVEAAPQVCDQKAVSQMSVLLQVISADTLSLSLPLLCVCV